MEQITFYNQAKAKHPADSKKMEEAKDTIIQASNSLLSRAHQLQKDSASLRVQLDDFRSSTFEQWASMNAHLEDLRRKLSESELRYLESVIKQLQLASSQQSLEYDNGTAIPWTVYSIN
jgi:hypothetical protein